MVLLLELAPGLAALWVFVFHIKDFYADAYPLTYQFSNYGHLGVPMFFVVSGYVITLSAEKNLSSGDPPTRFLKSRFLRIYPTYSFLLILAIPYLLEAISSLKTGHYLSPENLVARFDFWEWINMVLLTKVFAANSPDLSLELNAINAVYWTLAIEFQFYLVVFLALFLGKYFKLAIALLSIIAVVLKIFPADLNYSLFIHYWPSFSVGIALAYLHRNNFDFHLNSALSALLVLGFFAVAIFIVSGLSPTERHTSHLLFASAFGICLWFFSDLEILLKRVKNSRNRLIYWTLEPWLIIGAMSYYLYLLHVKLYLIPLMFIRQVADASGILVSVATIIGTLLLCYPFYYFVERKFLSKNLKKIHQRAIINPRGTPDRIPSRTRSGE